MREQQQLPAWWRAKESVLNCLLLRRWGRRGLIQRCGNHPYSQLRPNIRRIIPDETDYPCTHDIAHRRHFIALEQNYTNKHFRV